MILNVEQLPSRFNAAKASPAPAKDVEVLPPQAVMTSRRARPSGLAEPVYLANTLDVNRIQSALRSAERGDTFLYFTIVRDMIASCTHLQSEWQKRKMVIVGQPYSLIPHNKDDEDDKLAVEVIHQMIDGCRNWTDACLHLLDATLMPVAAAEKIFEEVGESENSKYKHKLRYKLSSISPIPSHLLCFKLPYQNRMGDQAYNADAWESWLRFYETNDIGNINYSLENTYAPDPECHIIHRGNILSPSIPPNFGGQIRSILFWWLLSTQGRDWWALFAQKFGSPFIVGKADAQNKETVQFLQQAFSLATQIGGLVVDKRAEVELVQASAQDGGSGHKMFLDFCNDQISKIVVGQTLSASPKNTGLGSGLASQSEAVRDDIKIADQSKFSDTLERQLFEQFLRINGYKGRAPKIKWGGKRDEDAVMFTKGLAQLKAAGYMLDDSGIQNAKERLGYGIKVDESANLTAGVNQPNAKRYGVDNEDKSKDPHAL